MAGSSRTVLLGSRAAVDHVWERWRRQRPRPDTSAEVSEVTGWFVLSPHHQGEVLGAAAGCGALVLKSAAAALGSGAAEGYC
jgi:hypothetical protein